MIETKKDLNRKEAELEEMIKAGVHFGHKTSNKHPKMESFVYGVKNGVSIIDVEKTREKLEEALDYVGNLVAQGGVLMIVSTKVQSKNIANKVAKECNLPYMTERWLGGTFTNFNTIKKRVDYLKELEKKKEEGELEKYTKKERLDIDREIESLERKFGGLKNLSKLPDAIFVANMDEDDLAIKEARMKGIKVIGIADTNVNPEKADYPIPANDDAIPSIEYIFNKLKEVVLQKSSEQKPKEE